MSRITFLIIITLLLPAAALSQQPNKDAAYPDTLVFDDGTFYMGEISDSLFNGQGKCIYPDGVIYEGSWKDGLWDGYGKVVYPDGDIYTGNFVKHKKEGKGTYFYNSGAKYEGEWKNDMFNGEGRLVFEDGGIYEGEWKNDRKHGLGRLTEHDGKKHIGYFFEDEFLGFPSDTYILDNVELTDDLREWGFRNVSVSTDPIASIGLTYGTGNIATVGLCLDYSNQIFFGFSIGLNIDRPIKGINFNPPPYNAYANDKFAEGSFISTLFECDMGIMLEPLSIGVSGGIGLSNRYNKCQANAAPELYEGKGLKAGDSYYNVQSDDVKFVYRGYLKRVITVKEKPRAKVSLGYGYPDGLFVGLGFYCKN